MRTITAAFVAQKNADTNVPIYLYTITNYNDAGGVLRLAEWTENITYDSQVYTAFPIAHSGVGESSDGEISGAQVSIANASRTIATYLENYEWRGKKIQITLVWLAEIADAAANLSWTYYIDSWTETDEAVVFELKTQADTMLAELPRAVWTRNRCRYVAFKSTECGYAGAETECDRTLQRCRALANSTRYGGFPSIPASGAI